MELERHHASTRTTQLYDRRRDEVNLDEVERISIVSWNPKMPAANVHALRRLEYGVSGGPSNLGLQ
jgi:hypothetical protein